MFDNYISKINKKIIKMETRLTTAIHAPISKAQKKHMKRASKTQKIALKRADEIKIQKSKVNVPKVKDQKSLRQTKQPRLINH